MLRAVLYLFIAIILISLLRTIIQVVRHAASALFEPETPPEQSTGVRTVGELKRDPVCGTYVSTAVSVKRTVAGEVIHFCSQACSDKYKA